MWFQPEVFFPGYREGVICALEIGVRARSKINLHFQVRKKAGKGGKNKKRKMVGARGFEPPTP